MDKEMKIIILALLSALLGFSCSSVSQNPITLDVIDDLSITKDMGPTTQDDLKIANDTHTTDATQVDMTRQFDETCFQKPQRKGKVAFQDIDEVSGIAVSRQQEIIWVHNDSGEKSAKFYALSFDGKIKGVFELEGAIFDDWEDMAIAEINGKSFLYFADTGDNAARKGTGGRDNIQVYRVEEPIVVASNTPENIIKIPSFETYDFTYPDNPTDCESLFVDPQTGDLYFLEKKNSGETFFFRSPPPVDGQSITLEKLHSLRFGSKEYPGSSYTTAGAISPDRRAIVIKTYTSVLLFPWKNGESFEDASSKIPIPIPRPGEIQSEAVDFGDIGDGYGIVSIPEGANANINFVKDSCQ